jgi:hypothetical protein
MNNDDIAYCYHALGISADTPAWSMVRKSYRKLINQWHPDRARDASSQRVAEDQTKTINVAYEKLARFYEEHGYLPPNPSAIRRRAPSPAKQPSPAPKTASAPEPVFEQHTADSTIDSPEYGLNGIRFLLALVIAAATVSIIFFPVFNTPNPGESSNGSVHPKNSTPSTRRPAVNAPVFTLGSTLGEVIAAQGVPTRTDDNIWYFGLSSVVFNNGVVTSWQEHPDNPLHIDADETANSLAGEFFTYGSSRAHVSTVQGKPTRIEDDVWYYGESMIYFDNNKVIAWHESPFSPLRIKKPATQH